MNKTILLIICFSFISLVLGIFTGYRMNPINEETINDLESFTKELDKINNTVKVNTDFFKTQMFVSILIDLSTKIKNGKKEAALAVIEGVLIDIRSQIIDNAEEKLNDDEKLLLELINNQIANDKKFERN
ncbi:hypothetical protein [Desulfobulbus oralis]|nr:hypothetical protein [Desulfobulbus oralis]